MVNKTVKVFSKDYHDEAENYTFKWEPPLGPTKETILFDLKNDPLEEKNIVDEKPDIVKKMEGILSQFTKDSKDDAGILTDEDIKKAKETLLKLGYI